MKVDKVIDVIHAIDDKKVPSDIIDILDVSHWSEGLEDYIDVGNKELLSKAVIAAIEELSAE